MEGPASVIRMAGLCYPSTLDQHPIREILIACRPNPLQVDVAPGIGMKQYFVVSASGEPGY